MARLNRRDFLKMGAVAGLGAAAAVIPKKDVFASVRKLSGRRLAMAIDLDKCTGCHACSVACKAKFDVPLGVWRSWVKIEERGSYPNTKRSFLPRLCNHCDDPPCVKVCPSGASTQREDGIVMVKEKICVGCKLCIAACPYQSRFPNPVTKIADKCDFCRHLVDQGVVPACVNACPAKVRVFGDLNNPNSEISKILDSKPTRVLKPKLGTEPQVFYTGAYTGADELAKGGEQG